VRLEITADAERAVRQLIRAHGPGAVVRVFAQPGGERGDRCCGADGGCGTSPEGPLFRMAFDRVRTGDMVLPVDGFTLVVDPESAEILEGGTIDFVPNQGAAGFRIRSPRMPDASDYTDGGAEAGECGCGAAGGCS
jgi:Fe-S cluster assembly iron-binding protein IscA